MPSFRRPSCVVAPWRAIGLAAVFVPFYLYVFLAVDPRLVYHAQRPAFRTDGAFLAERARRPGGMVDYAAGLLAQSYPRPWAGALVVTATALGVCLAGGLLLSSAGGKRPPWAHLLAAAPLAALHGSYDYPLSASLGVLIALAAAAGYARLPGRSLAVRLCAVAVGTAVGYHLAGAAALLGGLLCGLFEIVTARRRLGGLCLVLTAAIPAAASAWRLDLPLPEAYVLSLPLAYESGWPIASAALLGLFPAALLVRACGGRLLAAAGGADRAPDPETAPPGRRLRLVAATLAPAVLFAVSAGLGWDRAARPHVRLARLAARRDWTGLLQQARRMDAAEMTPPDVYYVNRALFHTGRLLDEMFAYPQTTGTAGLMLEWSGEGAPAEAWRCDALGDLMLELGHVNEAEHLTCEALEMLGERPDLLRRLAVVYVLKDQPVAARTYLTALGRHLLHARQARRLLDKLRADPGLAGEPRLDRIRGLMPTADPPAFEIRRPGAEQLLGRLLAGNRRNRMAFEYLTAYYLLTNRLAPLAAHLPRLDDLGYRRLPRHVAEAVVLHAYNVGGPTAPPARPVRPEVRRRFDEFVRARRRFRDDPRRGRDVWKHDHADSYFTYATYGGSAGAKR